MTSNDIQVLGLLISIIAVLVIPFIIALMRMTVKWTRIESRLNELTDDMKTLIENKDKVHADIIATMAQDRKATNERLRWVEEHIWRNSRNAL